MTSLFARNCFGDGEASDQPWGPLDRDALLHGTPRRWLWTVRLSKLLVFSSKIFGDQDIGFDDQLIGTGLLHFANAIAHAGAPATIGRHWCEVQSFRAVLDGIHMIDVFFQGRAEELWNGSMEKWRPWLSLVDLPTW